MVRWALRQACAAVTMVFGLTMVSCQLSVQSRNENPCAGGFELVPFVENAVSVKIEPKCYRFFSQKVTFEKAIERCDKLGASLATPKHEIEAESLANYVLKKKLKVKRYWIGLTDKEEEGVFKWEDDGTRLRSNFSFWTITEPHSSESAKVGSEGDQQDCVKMAIWIFSKKSSAQFYDSYCSKMESFACEKETIKKVEPLFESRAGNDSEEIMTPNGTIKLPKNKEVDFISHKNYKDLYENVSREHEYNLTVTSEGEEPEFPLKITADYKAKDGEGELVSLNSSKKHPPAVSDKPFDIDTPIEPTGGVTRNSGSNSRRYKRRRTCSLTCETNYIQAACPLKYFPQMENTRVVLNNESCRPRKNRTHLIVHTKLDDCGTISDNVPKVGKLSFRNTIRLVANGAGIVRNPVMARALTELMTLDCRYPQHHSVSHSFSPEDGKPPVYRTQAEGPMFDHVVLLYKADKYECPYAREEYPVKIPLSQRIYLEVTVDMASERVELHPVSCYATPDSNPFNSNNYVLMQNGCIEDSTFRIEESPSKKVSRFSVEAFRFVGYFRQVYVHCEMLLCKMNSKSSPRCPYACDPDARYRRRRRDTENGMFGEEIRQFTGHSGMITLVDEMVKINKGKSENEVKPQNLQEKGRANEKVEPAGSQKQNDGRSFGTREKSAHLVLLASVLLVKISVGNLYI